MAIIPVDIYLKKNIYIKMFVFFELGFLLFMGVWELYETQVLWNMEIIISYFH